MYCACISYVFICSSCITVELHKFIVCIDFVSDLNVLITPTTIYVLILQ